MTRRGKRNVAGVMVNVIDYDEAVQEICYAAESRQALTVTALAVHGVMTGALDEEHKYRLNHFGLVVPDGQPVRWALNLLHKARLKDRVYGPELSLRVLAEAERRGLPVFFYGSTPAVLQHLKGKLLQRFPALQVTGIEPSQFRELDARETNQLAARIVESGARMVFVGLGCPRQEVFAYEMEPLVQMPLLAVGAAFDFISGTLPQAPPVLQRAGLEWAYRLYREPRRLWRRYLQLNPHYVSMIVGQVLGFNYSREGAKPMRLHRYG